MKTPLPALPTLATFALLFLVTLASCGFHIWQA
jgi:outer membrane lipopolysaccharide assembly protein LptE/RlpB